MAVPPPSYGGIEAMLDVLAVGLQAAGHEVLLWSTGDSTCPVPSGWTYATAVGIGVAGPVAELRHVIEAYDAFRAWGVDIVHDHTLSGPVYAQRFPRLAVVTTNHGPFDVDLAPLYRAVAHRVPVVAISHHQAASRGNIPVRAVIHHGVDIADFPAGGGHGGYAAFLGRMMPTKGVHVAVGVAREAGIPLRIAAKMREPAERGYFDSEVAPVLGGDAEYVGELDRRDKLQLLGDAACLLNPIAWAEPFGMVMIESLACGTPVVATPCGSAPEIIAHGETGFVSPVADLPRALQHVHTLDRSACRQAVKERFSAARMVDDHLAVYMRTLAERSQ